MSETIPSITNKASQSKQEKKVAVQRNHGDQKKNHLIQIRSRVNIINKKTFMNTHKPVC